MNQTSTTNLLKRRYEKPLLKKIGHLKNITLKTGSVADGTMMTRSI